LAHQEGTLRKHVPIDGDQRELLKLLTTAGTRERATLLELVPSLRKARLSEASVLSALIALGARAVRVQELAAGGAELVAVHAVVVVRRELEEMGQLVQSCIHVLDQVSQQNGVSQNDVNETADVN
jgi:hypothetical protein